VYFFGNKKFVRKFIGNFFFLRIFLPDFQCHNSLKNAHENSQETLLADFAARLSWEFCCKSFFGMFSCGFSGGILVAVNFLVNYFLGIFWG
jgi:hypothetical protein